MLGKENMTHADRNDPSRERATRDYPTRSRLYQCRICSGYSAIELEAKEMMAGTRKSFRYFECPSCGCVQIAEIPESMDRYYKHDYYSFVVPDFSLLQRFKIRALRFIDLVGGLSTYLRRLLGRHRGLALIFLYHRFARDRNVYILDVGAGAGKTVRDLLEIGYKNVLGIDLFIPQDICYRGRTLVRRCDIFSVDGRWDIISFHHSLEHMPAQKAVLARALEILSSDGCVIVRIPIVGGYVWRHYREHWVQLDPPRHLYLHSLKSLRVVASSAGFDVSEVFYDSWGFQFWGSELYRRDIPLNDPRSPVVNKKNPLFSASQMREFERRAQLANGAGEGDQIVAVLVPKRN